MCSACVPNVHTHHHAVRTVGHCSFGQLHHVEEVFVASHTLCQKKKVKRDLLQRQKRPTCFSITLTFDMASMNPLLNRPSMNPLLNRPSMNPLLNRPGTSRAGPISPTRANDAVCVRKKLFFFKKTIIKKDPRAMPSQLSESK